MTDLDELRLLPAFKTGDKKAFEQVFKFYYKPLRLQAYLILKNEEDAEDQVQQLFLDMWNRQLYRNVEESVKSYLYTAIKNRCFNCLTKASHRNKVFSDYTIIANSSLNEEYKEPVLQPLYRAALNELPAQRFRAFHLVHMEDKKYDDAAREMGISINSLKSHLKLAVKSLKIRLQK